MTHAPKALVRVRNSAFLLAVIVVAATIVTCSSSKPPAAESSASSSPQPAPPPAPHYEVAPAVKVLGSVDVLNATPASQSEPGHVDAQGWAASAVAAAPVTVVALLIDGKSVAETKTFFPRADVMAAYGRPDFEKSGWKIEATIKPLGPGKHPVTIRASNAHGDTVILPGVALALHN